MGARVVTASAQLLVVDASVAMKWHLVEDHSDEATRFLKPRFALHAPEFFAAECGNVLLKKSLQLAEIDESRARSILADLLTQPVQLHVESALASSAFDLAIEIARPKLAIYDFFYLALAIRLDCGYVTADRVFWESIRPTAYSDRLVWVADPLG